MRTALESYRLLGPLTAALVFTEGCGPVGSPGTTGELEQAVHHVCAVGDAGVGQLPEGIDVSVYQGAVDWAGVKSAGKVFAFIRVSHGLTGTDTRFAANWPAARTAGVIRGPYEYFQADDDALGQAQFFVDGINAAGGFEDGDLPPVLDLEDMGSQTSAAVTDAVGVWLQYVSDTTGRRPIIYTGSYFFDALGSGATGYATSHPLWDANYTTSCPLIPDAWTSWAFWQYSGSGTSGGVSGAVDLDVFNGTTEELQALIAASVLPVDAGTSSKPDAATPPGPDAATIPGHDAATPPRADAAASGPDATGSGPDASSFVVDDAGAPDAAAARRDASGPGADGAADDESPDADVQQPAADTAVAEGCACGSGPGQAAPGLQLLLALAYLASRARSKPAPS